MSLSAVTSLALVMMAAMPFSDKPYEAETVVYACPGGDPLRATLYTPTAKTDEPRPAVVLIHGGAWITGSRRQLFWYGRRFAEAGYVALSVNYRTMPGAPFPAPLEDVKSAVRWLRANAGTYNIDPNRIAALGTSAGGHLALMLALTSDEKGFDGTENPGYPSDIGAAVSLYGPADLRRLMEGQERGFLSRYTLGPQLRDFVGKEKLGGRDPWDAASPVTYVSPKTPPILCIHGTKDTLVPVEQSRELFKKLQEAGVPSECIEVPGRSHAFDHLHPSARRELFPRILSFLEQHLGKK